MPKDFTPDNDIPNRNDKGQFTSKGEQLDKAKQKLEQLNNAYKTVGEANERLRAGYEKAVKGVNAYRLANERLSARYGELRNTIKANTDGLAKHNAVVKDHTDTISRAQRATGGWTMGLIKLGAISYIASRAFSALGNVAEKRLDVLTLYPDAIGAISKSIAGLKNTTIGEMSETLAKFSNIGPIQQFSLMRNPNVIKGIAGARSQMADILGNEGASGLIEQISKTFGTDQERQKAFWETSARQGLKSALAGFVNTQNVDVFSRAKNTAEIYDRFKAGTLDGPTMALIQAQQAKDKLGDTMERLVAIASERAVPALEKLSATLDKYLPEIESGISKAIGWISEHPKTALGIAGGLVAGRAVGGGLVGTGIGLGARGALAGGRAAGGALLANPAVLAGVAVAAGAATSVYATAGIIKARKEIANAHATAIQDAIDEQRKGEYMVSHYGGDRMAVLRGRQHIYRGRLGQYYGERAAGETPRMPEEMVPIVGRALQQTSHELAMLQRAESARITPHKVFARISKETADIIGKAGKGLTGLNKALGQFAEYAGNETVARTEERRVRQEQLQLPMALAASETQLAMQKYALGQITPVPELAPFLAAKELPQLNQAIERQIAIMEKYLGSIDQNTMQGATEANGVKSQIMGLRIQEKSANVSIVQAIMNEQLGQIFGSPGRFEKFILTRERNTGLGMRAGMAREQNVGGYKPLGSFTPSGRAPQSMQEFLARQGIDAGQYLGIYDVMRNGLPKRAPAGVQDPLINQAVPWELRRPEPPPSTQPMSYGGVSRLSVPSKGDFSESQRKLADAAQSINDGARALLSGVNSLGRGSSIETDTERGRNMYV